jgi:hypothetical protein
MEWMAYIPATQRIFMTRIEHQGHLDGKREILMLHKRDS